MTIAAAYLTSEGLVLGADSTTTVVVTAEDGNPSIVQVLNYAQKVFEVGQPKEGRFGICTWGASGFRGTSHRTLVARLASGITGETTVEEATDAFIKLVEAECKVTGEKSSIGYFMGGYDPNTYTPRCFRIEFEDQKVVDRHELKIGDAMFTGAPLFFGRVFFGYDSSFKPDLIEELKKAFPTLDKEFFDKFEEVFDTVGKKLCAAGYRDLPIREAIDFVHAYLHITIKAFKFQFGPPICGGPIEIGFISTDRKFRWVTHKEFNAAII